MRASSRLGLLILLASACRPEAPAVSGAETLALDTMPSVEIDATAPDGRVRFGELSGGLRLADGRIALGDEGEHAVLLFTPDGAPAGSIGRDGKGPGEFKDIGSVSRWLGDSIGVFDYTLRRWTAVNLGDQGMRMSRFAGAPASALLSSRSGLVLSVPAVPTMEPTRSNAGVLTPVKFVLIHGGDTTTLFDSLPAVDPRPGGRAPAFAVAGSRAYVGLTDSAFAMVWDSTGRRLADLRVIEDPAPGSRQRYDHAVDALERQYPRLATSLESMLRDLPFPERMSAYTALFGAPDGTVWVLLTQFGDSVTRLRAVSPSGRLLGTPSLPFALRILDIGNDYILGVRENEAGEQRVVVYPIRRTEGGHP